MRFRFAWRCLSFFILRVIVLLVLFCEIFFSNLSFAEQELHIEIAESQIRGANGNFPILFGKITTEGIFLLDQNFNFSPIIPISENIIQKQLVEIHTVPKTDLPVLGLNNVKIIDDNTYKLPNYKYEINPPINDIEISESRFLLLFKKHERKTCTNTTRFASLFDVVENLKDKVLEVVFTTDKRNWLACGQKIKLEFEKLQLKVIRKKQASKNSPAMLSISFNNYNHLNISNNDLPIALSPEKSVSIPVTPKYLQSIDVPLPNVINEEKKINLDRDLRTGLYVQKKLIKPNPEGWFVIPLQNIEAIEIEVLDNGTSRFSKNIVPLLLKPGINSIAQYSIFQRVVFTPNAKQQNIFLAGYENIVTSLKLDLSTQLGTGFITPTLSSEKGFRLFFAEQALKRDFLDGDVAFDVLGSANGKANLSATMLIKLAYLRTVPWSIFDISFKGGLGSEFYKSFIKTPQMSDKYLTAWNTKTELIPDQILLPFVYSEAFWKEGKLSFKQIVHMGFFYVVGAGFFTTWNTFGEVSYRLLENIGALFTVASYEEKYPSLMGMSRVRFTNASIGLRYAIF